MKVSLVEPSQLVVSGGEFSQIQINNPIFIERNISIPLSKDI